MATSRRTGTVAASFLVMSAVLLFSAHSPVFPLNFITTNSKPHTTEKWRQTLTVALKSEAEELHSNTGTVVVLVLSSRSHGMRRDSIRQSWGKGHSNIRFIVGDRGCLIPPDYRLSPHSCEHNQTRIPTSDILAWQGELRKTEDDIIKEVEVYGGDLWLVSMVDSYRGLARKLKLAYERALSETDATWFLKVDDDTFVDVPFVTRILTGFKFEAYGFVANSFSSDHAVARGGKWAEHVFQEDVYPPYPIGAGHAVSRNLAEYISHNKDILFEYQGEDTSMGIWISQFASRVTLIPSPAFEGHDGNCDDLSRAVIGHDIPPEKMVTCQLARENRTLVTDSA